VRGAGSGRAACGCDRAGRFGSGGTTEAPVPPVPTAPSPHPVRALQHCSYRGVNASASPRIPDPGPASGIVLIPGAVAAEQPRRAIAVASVSRFEGPAPPVDPPGPPPGSRPFIHPPDATAATGAHLRDPGLWNGRGTSCGFPCELSPGRHLPGPAASRASRLPHRPPASSLRACIAHVASTPRRADSAPASPLPRRASLLHRPPCRIRQRRGEGAMPEPYRSHAGPMPQLLSFRPWQHRYPCAVSSLPPRPDWTPGVWPRRTRTSDGRGDRTAPGSSST
jgi:hypothetical protein